MFFTGSVHSKPAGGRHWIRPSTSGGGCIETLVQVAILQYKNSLLKVKVMHLNTRQSKDGLNLPKVSITLMFTVANKHYNG